MRKLSGLQTCQQEIKDRRLRQSSLLSVQQFLNDDKLEQLDPDEKDDPLLSRLIDGQKPVIPDFDSSVINQHLNSFDAILDKAAQESIKRRCSVSQVLQQSNNPKEMPDADDTDTTILDIQKLSLKPGGVVSGFKQELSKANSFFKKKHGRDMKAAEKKQFEQMWNQQYEMVVEGSLLRKDQQLNAAKVLQMSLPMFPQGLFEASVERKPPPISGMMHNVAPEIPLSYVLATEEETFVSPKPKEKPFVSLKEKPFVLPEEEVSPSKQTFALPKEVEMKPVIEAKETMPPPPSRPKRAIPPSSMVTRSQTETPHDKKNKPLGKYTEEMRATDDLCRKIYGLAPMPTVVKPAKLSKACSIHKVFTNGCLLCEMQVR